MVVHETNTETDIRRRAAARKVVVAHGGSRDGYQVALALEEAGQLETLVTDLYWDEQSSVRKLMPKRVARSMGRRNVGGLRASRVITTPWSGWLALGMERVRLVPLAWRRMMRRFSDLRIGGVAGRIARQRNADLLSYSYYGSQAFAAYGKPAMLFQVHPHPLTVRRLLQEELQRNPQCAASLEQEWELSLPKRDFDLLVHEAKVATHYIVASTFTRASLIEHGVPAAAISVVPYGIDLQRFHPGTVRGKHGARLELLFVGRINQRKGLSYLLEALKQVTDLDVHLTICGRVVDDLSLFDEWAERVTIRPSISAAELVQAYQNADLFVFPSIVEGFAQVLLESLACGVPILSTTHTAAPDLIEDGVQGFVVEPRRPDLLAESIRWAHGHRAELLAMGARARARAEQFTWERFRAGVNLAVAECQRNATEDAVEA